MAVRPNSLTALSAEVDDSMIQGGKPEWWPNHFLAFLLQFNENQSMVKSGRPEEAVDRIKEGETADSSNRVVD